jgi:hypothetical protein
MYCCSTIWEERDGIGPATARVLSRVLGDTAAVNIHMFSKRGRSIIIFIHYIPGMPIIARNDGKDRGRK